MPNILTRKLELFSHLSDDDRKLLEDVTARSRAIPAHQAIIREGEAPADVHLVVEGLACRSKYLRGGERHIFAYLIPGDFCDLHVFILKAMDHTIETLSPCRVVDIPRDRVLEMTARPELAQALWWATLVDEATLREWLVNIGQRDAAERIAHLICEMHLRMKSVGLAQGGEFTLPITQTELGDTMGLTSVHVNRMLQSLRQRQFIQFDSGRIVIPDVDRLREMSGFNPNYLHLNGGKNHSPASLTRN